MTVLKPHLIIKKIVLSFCTTNKDKIKELFFFLIRYGFKIVVRDRRNISIQEKDPEVLEMEAVSPKKDNIDCICRKF
jgi:hypothetical protein